MKVAIIGAGLCGLSSAYDLLSKGHEVSIYEKEFQVGGMAASKNKDGYRYDLGVHVFHMMDDYASNLVNDVLKDNIYKKEFTAKTLIKNKFYDYPPSVERVKRLPPGLKENMLGSIPSKGEFNPTDDLKSFESWLIKRMGMPFYEHYFKDYTTKWWGRTPDNISSELIKRAYESLFKHARMIKSYPEIGGVGEFSLGFKNLVVKRGAQIMLGWELCDVNNKHDKISELSFKKIGENNSIETICDFDAVINTAPLDYLCRFLDVPFPKSLSYRSMIILLIKIRNHEVLDVDWLHFAPHNLIISRIHEPRKFSNGVAPNSFSSLVVEIPCQLNDAIWNLSDEAVIERVLCDLENVQIISKEDAIGFDITRLKHSHPIYSLEYEKDLKKIFDELNIFNNLVTTGRLGGFQYTTMDRSIRMGLEASEEIIRRGTKRDIN